MLDPTETENAKSKLLYREIEILLGKPVKRYLRVKHPVSVQSVKRHLSSCIFPEKKTRSSLR